MAINVDSGWWKTLFDEIYLLTDARSVGDEEITRREVDVICDLLPLQPSHRILDLCGGQGRHSLELCARGFACCTVLDYSAFLLEQGSLAATGRGLKVDFIRGDAAATGLPEGSFDHVLILGNSLGYLPRADDDLKIAAEAFRLLRPGGWFLVDVADGTEIRRTFRPNAWHEVGEDIVVCRQRELDGDRVRARELILSRDRGLVRENTYAIRIYGQEEMMSLVRRAGFGQVDVLRGYPARRNGVDYGFMNNRFLLTARRRGR